MLRCPLGLVLIGSLTLIACDPEGLSPLREDGTDLPGEHDLRDQFEEQDEAQDPDAPPADDPPAEEDPEEPTDPETPTPEDPTPTPPPPEEPPGEPPGVAPVETWGFSFGGVDFDQAKDVAVDGEGNVYVTGWFRGDATFGDVTLSAVTEVGAADPTPGDIFLFSLDPDGDLRWAKRFGGEQHDEGTGVATDAAGNVYLLADIQTPTDFGGGAIMSHEDGSDVALASFTSDGAPRWSAAFGGDGMDLGFGIDANHDRVCVSGGFDGSMYIGPGLPVVHAVYAIDAFVTCFNTDGQALWVQAFGAWLYDSGTAVAVAPDGTTWLAADVSAEGGNVDPGAGELIGAGGWDSVLAAYDHAGNLLFAESFGGTGNEGTVGLGLDPAGNPIAGGVYSSAVDFGGGALAHADQYDAFVYSLGADGQHRWSLGFGAEGHDQALALDVDAFGNSFVVGRYDDSLDVDGASLNASGDYDVFVASWDRFGEPRWARSFGGHKYDQAMGVAAGPDGAVYVVGFYREHTDFAGPLVSAGDSDGFVVRIDQVEEPAAP